MKLYQMKKGVSKYYRKNVKGNEDLTEDQVQRKLTRNIQLAIKVPISEHKILYLYGKLHIFTYKNTITRIRNIKEMENGWFYKDMNRLRELNRILGIENTKTQWQEEGNVLYMDEYAKGFTKQT